MKIGRFSDIPASNVNLLNLENKIEILKNILEMVENNPSYKAYLIKNELLNIFSSVKAIMMYKG